MAASRARSKHFLGAAAGGDEADAGFDEAHVGFGVGLAARGVQADLRAAAEGEAEGRGDDRARAEFDGRGHLLEAVNDVRPARPTRLPARRAGVA